MKLRYAFIILAASSSFITGCGKDDDKKVIPAPTTGTVKGSFTPVAGGSMVYLIAGTDTTKITPTATGTFEKTDVKAGTYSVTVKAKEGYDAPIPVSASVTAGQTTTVPAITLTQMPANGTMSVKIGNTSYAGTPTPSTWAGDADLTLSSGGYDIQIKLPDNLNGPGVFTQSNSNLHFYIKNMGQLKQWYSFMNGGAGTLTVTSYNAATKKGNATFTFTGMAAGSYADLVGTEGKLTGVKLAL